MIGRLFHLCSIIQFIHFSLFIDIDATIISIDSLSMSSSVDDYNNGDIDSNSIENYLISSRGNFMNVFDCNLPISQDSSFRDIEKLSLKRINELDCHLEELNAFLPDFPIEINKIISSYDHKNVCYELYKRVINRLNHFLLQSNQIEEDERMVNDGNDEKKEIGYLNINLEFDSKQFLNELDQFLTFKRQKERKDKRSMVLNRKLKNEIESKLKIINFDDSFWIDLSRLISKWLIYMKKKLKNENFNSFLDKIGPIYTHLREDNSDLQKRLPEFDSLASFGFCNGFCQRTIVFLYSEIFDRGNEILNLYHEIIKEFYYGDASCFEIMIKYFGGHFDNDPILKAMIYLYDGDGELKKCFNNSNSIFDPSKNKRKSRMEIGDNFHYSTELIKARIVENFSHGHDHVNGEILEFYENNNLRFAIKDYSSLYMLMRNLKRINCLTMEIIRKFIGFPEYWNQETFKEYINMGKETHFSDYEIFMGYLFE